MVAERPHCSDAARVGAAVGDGMADAATLSVARERTNITINDSFSISALQS